MSADSIWCPPCFRSATRSLPITSASSGFGGWPGIPWGPCPMIVMVYRPIVVVLLGLGSHPNERPGHAAAGVVPAVQLNQAEDGQRQEGRSIEAVKFHLDRAGLHFVDPGRVRVRE